MGLELTILYERDEDGWWSAEIPEIPGAVSQGHSLEEARTMVIDATLALSRSRREDAFRLIRPDGFERLRLAA